MTIWNLFPEAWQIGWKKTSCMMVAWTAVSMVGSSCCQNPETPFEQGTYRADLSCRASVQLDGGIFLGDEFESSAEFTVESGGGFLIGGVEVVVGAMVLRSIPTADLTFEVIEVTSDENDLIVIYEPRPTLPGIGIEGNLTERYRARCDAVLVTAEASLIVTDASGESEIQIDCSGLMPRVVQE